MGRPKAAQSDLLFHGLETVLVRRLALSAAVAVVPGAAGVSVGARPRSSQGQFVKGAQHCERRLLVNETYYTHPLPL